MTKSSPISLFTNLLIFLLDPPTRPNPNRTKFIFVQIQTILVSALICCFCNIILSILHTSLFKLNFLLPLGTIYKVCSLRGGGGKGVPQNSNKNELFF